MTVNKEKKKSARGLEAISCYMGGTANTLNFGKSPCTLPQFTPDLIQDCTDLMTHSVFMYLLILLNTCQLIDVICGNLRKVGPVECRT